MHTHWFIMKIFVFLINIVGQKIRKKKNSFKGVVLRVSGAVKESTWMVQIVQIVCFIYAALKCV